MSNFNISNTATTSRAAAPINKPINDQQKNTNGFQSTFEQAMQAEKAVQPSSNFKMVMPDGNGNYQLEPVTVELVQKRFGLSRAEAEVKFAGMKAEYDKSWAKYDKLVSDAEEFGTPEAQKKYMMSKEVESVARDATGNIVAKLYKDGSFYCSNQLAGTIVMGDGRSHVQEMQQIAKQPGVVVTHYKNKVTDFDLLPEQIANDKKQQQLYPEFYSQYSKEIQEVMELRERILAL